MKIWFDTEFYEDGRTIDLISIGMVREDGATYYAETYDALSVASRSDWLKENVFPHLAGPVRTRDEMRAEILEFAGAQPEFWAYYADYDWVLLCQLFGRMIDLPKGWPMFCRDVQQLRVERGVAELPKQTSAEHNALADALWTREAWQFLNSTPVHHVGGSIVPPHYSGSALAFEPGVLYVNKDGSGYIAINEEDFVLEDDRCEGPDGPEGSIHWIARMDASEIIALRDFLNGNTTADRLADKIEDLIAEFGDDPKAALECVSEHLQLRRHARAVSREVIDHG